MNLCCMNVMIKNVVDKENKELFFFNLMLKSSFFYYIGLWRDSWCLLWRQIIHFCVHIEFCS